MSFDEKYYSDHFWNYPDHQAIKECKSCISLIGLMTLFLIYIGINVGFFSELADGKSFIMTLPYLSLIIHQIFFPPTVLLTHFHPWNMEKYLALVDRYYFLTAIPMQVIMCTLIQYLPGILRLTEIINTTIYQQLVWIQIGVIAFCWMCYFGYLILYSLTDFTQINQSIV